MNKLFSIAFAGIAATCLSLATPAVSQAQNFSVQFGYSKGGYHNPYSPNVNVGFGYSNYGHGHNHGYGHNSGYYGGHNSGYYGGHNSGYQGGYNSGYDCLPNQNEIIIQPTHYHWTPTKGYHSHGNIIVPHGNHYHVQKY